MLQIREIREKSEWDNFLEQIEPSAYPFFQSWTWAEVQKKLGFDIERFGITERKKLIGIFCVIDVKAKRGHYIHVRHGPVFTSFKKEYFDFFLQYLKGFVRQKRASFIRLSPLLKRDEAIEGYLKKKNCISSPIHNMDAEICWVLDIVSPEEDLLKQMRKTHRYLVRKSQAMDIKIIRTKKVDDLQQFLHIYEQLSQRKHFVPHSGIEEEFVAFTKDDEEELYLAEYNGKIIAGAVIAFVQNEAIYRHGASLEEFRTIPASYLIQWEAIRDAKKRGKKLYNFWGIASTESKHHPWQGLTLFKTGFGGEKREFIHAYDLPISLQYWITYGIEYISKKKRGY